MTLYFRLLMILFKILLGPKRHPLDASVTHFRALPTDCDLNLHLTSSRYIEFMDAATIHFIGQMGILGKLLKRRCFPFNAAHDLTYIRPIKPFEKFSVTTRFVTWDDKYWYKEQRFEVDGELRAVGMARGVVVCRGAVVSLGEIAALTGENLVAPHAPEAVSKWRDLLEAKKAPASQYSPEPTSDFVFF
jgi:acyl-CoA thioesterase FadM